MASVASGKFESGYGQIEVLPYKQKSVSVKCVSVFIVCTSLFKWNMNHLWVSHKSDGEILSKVSQIYLRSWVGMFHIRYRGSVHGMMDPNWTTCYFGSNVMDMLLEWMMNVCQNIVFMVSSTLLSDYNTSQGKDIKTV